MENEILDVAIIGSGPAGLTAGIYCSRANLKTLIIGGEKWGGQLMLTTTVENFPGFPEGVQGPELMEKMKSQAEKFGSRIVFEDVATIINRHDGATRSAAIASSKKDPIAPPSAGLQDDGVFIIKTVASEYSAKSVIIATGADTVWLGLPNELRLIGHGVSSCAPCDAFFFRGKKVAVAGGGDSACEEALFLTKFASEVTIIHRRDQLRASKIMQERTLCHPQIKVIWNSEIVDILGNDHVTGLSIKTTTNSTSHVQNFSIDGLFVAVGHKPNSDIFNGFIETDEKGFIKRVLKNGFRTTTSMEGVFVAGDVHDHHYKQAVTAAAYGCEAAMEVERWLDSKKG